MSYYRFLLASALVPAALFAFPSSPEAATLSYRHASTADYTHTYTSTLSAEPASRFIDMSHSYKTAAVCFLGTDDCGDAGFGSMGGDDGYQIDTAQQCQNEGYTVTSCSLPAYPSGQCAYNGGYFAKCVEDKPRACEETGFGETACVAGMVVEATCSFDANYKKCKCDPCDGYDYTYEQATAQGYITDGSCQSCSETKYKRKENPCSGYSVCECGGEVGASTCYTGSTKKFSQCKACCDDTCPSGSSTDYTGSASGKTECGNTCYKCNSSCPSGSSTSYSGEIVSYNECGQACRTCNERCPDGMSTTHPGGCPSSKQNECGTKTCYGEYEQCWCYRDVHTSTSCTYAEDCAPGSDNYHNILEGLPYYGQWSCSSDFGSYIKDAPGTCSYGEHYPC